MSKVSIILPCRNEEKTIGLCIRKIKKVLKKHKINGEIIVSDSSKDNSPKIARKLRAKVIKHDKKGYGIACQEAFKVAAGEILIIGDADNTYDFSDIPKFINEIEKGNDFVIGSRIKGKIKKGAMPRLHQYFGNPLLSGILNFLFGTNISDSHSGFRAIKRDALDKLNLKTTGMEFASEMVILAAKNNLKIKEIPVTYSKRIGESKLSSFSDGWRHLRFMLMYSPTYVFLFPGLFLFLAGFLAMIPLLFQTVQYRGYDLTIPFMVFSSLVAILGYQVISIGLYAKIYAIHTGFEKHDKLIDYIAENVPMERGILMGFFVILLGISVVVFLFIRIFFERFRLSSINYLLFAMTILIIGFQTVFSVFFLSMMLVETRE